MDENQDKPTESTQKSRKKIRIGDLLVENKIISEQQLMAALADQKSTGHKLGHTLVELGFLEEQQLLDFLSQQLQIPYIDIKTYSLKVDVVKTLPEAVARRYRVIVLEQRERDVLVGMADPTDLFAYDELGHVLKKRVRQAVVRENDLLDMLDRMYRREDELTLTNSCSRLKRAMHRLFDCCKRYLKMHFRQKHRIFTLNRMKRCCAFVSELMVFCMSR